MQTVAAEMPANGAINLPFSYPRGLVVEPNGDIVVWLDPRGATSTKVMTLRGNTASELFPIDQVFRATHPSYAGFSSDSSGNLLFANGSLVVRSRADGVTISSVNTGYYEDAFSYTPAGDLFIATVSGQIKEQVGTAFPTLFNRDLSEFLGTTERALSYSSPATNRTSLTTDAQGNLYIAERDLHRIRKLAAGSCRGIPGPVAGGLVNSATFSYPILGEAESTAPGELVTIFGSGLGPSQVSAPFSTRTPDLFQPR